jgi:hypothetical protein
VFTCCNGIQESIVAVCEFNELYLGEKVVRELSVFMFEGCDGRYKIIFLVGPKGMW